MRRMFFSTLSALLVSASLSTPAFSTELALDSIEWHELQYRPDRPGRPGGPWHRGVQCKAVNRRGVPFYGRGPNMPAARDAALRSCYQVSRSCWMDGCRPI